MSAPDFAAGDLSVSKRLAAMGDHLHAGDSRYYIVDYRDPVVLGGCPAGSKLNSTQTGKVVWAP